MTLKALSALRYAILLWSGLGTVLVFVGGTVGDLHSRNWAGVELYWQVISVLVLMACSVALDRSVHGLAPSLVAAVGAGWMSRATMGLVGLLTPNWPWLFLMTAALAVLSVHCWYALGLGARAWGLLALVLFSLTATVAVTLTTSHYTPLLVAAVTVVPVSALIATRHPLWV